MALKAMAIPDQMLEDHLACHCEGDSPKQSPHRVEDCFSKTRNDKNNVEEQWDYLKARTH